MSAPLFRAEDLAHCAAIQRAHATSYSLATLFFPREERAATQVFYAFVRVADDIVDEPVDPNPTVVRSQFDAWVDRWHAVRNGASTDDPVLRAANALWTHYQLPMEYSDAFLGAMRRDIDTPRYETYRSLLDEYVYGSAAVVGLAMCRICGVADEKALRHARQLGEAMQLTNFLRDIREDLHARGRLYLALEDLRTYGVTEDDLKHGNMTPNMRSLLAEYAQRARLLYAASDEGIPLLPPHARRAVRLARVLYARILDRIEAADYDVFSRRASVPRSQKLLLAGRVLLTMR